MTIDADKSPIGKSVVNVSHRLEGKNTIDNQDFIYKPPKDLNLPLTEFYLSKQNDTMRHTSALNHYQHP